MRRSKFILVFTLLVLLDFFPPFFLLDDFASFFASYFFWNLLTLTVIIGGAFYIRWTWGG